jgi:hypothetical protein
MQCPSKDLWWLSDEVGVQGELSPQNNFYSFICLLLSRWHLTKNKTPPLLLHISFLVAGIHKRKHVLPQ